MGRKLGDGVAADTGWASVRVHACCFFACSRAARISASERIGQSQSSAAGRVSLRRLPRGFLLRAVRLRVFRPSIRSFADVYSLSSGVSAILARIGFRSTYMLHARTAASSTNAWHLKRPSQKRPLQRSSAFARRATHSLSRPMNHDRLESRRRFSSIASASAIKTSKSRCFGSAAVPSFFLRRGNIRHHRRATSSSGPRRDQIRPRAYHDVDVI